MSNARLAPCANCGRTPDFDEPVTCPCGSYRASEEDEDRSDPSLALAALDGAAVFYPNKR